MTLENWLVLAILAGALVLFINERLRADVVALLVLLTLALTGLVTVEEAFSGLSSPAVVTVGAVFVISGALTRSGVADLIARAVIKVAGSDPRRLTAIIMLTVGVMSAFMNNIGAVAIMLPVVVSVSNERKIAPSKLLIPLSFASLLGGNMTLIGTPPNILATGILAQYPGLEPFGFFDFLPSGLLVLAAGTIYMTLIGRNLLPERFPPSAPSQAYRLRPYLADMRVAPGSPLIGKSMTESGVGRRYDVSVIHIRRPGDSVLFPSGDRSLQEGDVILLEGRPGAILSASRTYRLEPVADGSPASVEQQLTPGTSRMVEATLAPRSDLVGKTLRQINFRALHGLSVLAIRHHGQSIVSQLADVRLEFGDALLIQGDADKIALLRADADFLLLDTPPLEMRRLRKAPIAALILLAVLITITFGWLHPSLAMTIGAVLMVLSGALSIDEAYQAIEWKSIFLIAGILPLGLAMETTGTAALIANVIVEGLGGYGVTAVFVGIFIMTAMLTEIISNAAATVLVVPIAIGTAFSLGASPQTFVMGTVIAASTSFLMPIGHQANVLVFGPGGYRFSDYTRVGLWLNIILLILVTLVLPLIWPFYP